MFRQLIERAASVLTGFLLRVGMGIVGIKFNGFGKFSLHTHFKTLSDGLIDVDIGGGG